MLPPGWARLATSPAPSGSAIPANTIGIVLVAFQVAKVGGPPVTMRSTFRWIISAANLGYCVGSRENLHSIVQFSPSPYPPSRAPSGTPPIERALAPAPGKPSLGSSPRLGGGTKGAKRFHNPGCMRTGGAASLNDLVRPRQHRRRNRQAEGFGGLEIDDQLELCRLLDREIAGLGPLEDLVDIDGGASGLLEEVRYIGHQATLTSVVLVLEHRGEPELNRAVQDPPAVKEEERIIQGEERIGTLSCQGGQGSLELLNGFLYL